MGNKRSSIGLQLAIMGASIAVFLGAISLVGGGFDDRNTRFWATVLSILFAHIVWFNVPIWMVATDARKKDAFPFQFTAITFCNLYAAGVVFLALAVVFSDISSGWVLVLNMGLLLGLVLSLGAFSVTNRAIEKMDADEKRVKAPAVELNLKIGAIRDRAAMCTAEGFGAALTAIDAVAEAMHFGTAESLAGSEAVDAEVDQHFKSIEMALVALDEAEGQEAEAVLVQKIVTVSQAAQRVIARREAVMKTLR